MLTYLKTRLDNTSLWIKGIAVVFVPVCILVATIFLISQIEVEARKAQSRINHSLQVKATLNEILSLMVDSESGVRGYVLWNDPYYLEPYRRASSQIGASLQRLDELLKIFDYQGDRMRDLREQVRRRMETLRQGVEIQDKELISAELRQASRDAMDKIRVIIGDMKLHELKQLEQYNRVYDRNLSRAHLSLIFIFILALLCGLIASYIVSASILNRVNSLERYAYRVARGRPAEWSDSGNDEIGYLGRNIKTMTLTLLARETALTHTREQLEQVNQDLANNLEETRAVNEELESFSYTVSHDLRAPLRHIAGFSDLLLKNADNLDTRNRRYLDIISRSVAQMNTLIDELLAFSRMGRSQLSLAPVDLQTLLTETLEQFSHEVENRRVEWNLDILPRVMGDVTMLRLVFQNLISNALKYSRKRNPAVITITAQKQPETGMVTITFKDNGVGFKPENFDKLFGVFQRFHSPEEYEGSGIGLATVRRIIHRHGGQITATGAVDIGAEFTLTLPYVRSETQPPHAPINRAAPPAQPEETHV